MYHIDFGINALLNMSAICKLVQYTAIFGKMVFLQILSEYYAKGIKYEWKLISGLEYATLRLSLPKAGILWGECKGLYVWPKNARNSLKRVIFHANLHIEDFVLAANEHIR